MSRKYRISYREMVNRIVLLDSIPKPYHYHRSGNSMLLFMNGVCYYASTMDEMPDKTPMPFNEVYFISKVKRYLEKNEIHKKIKPNYRDVNKIKFFDYNKDISPEDGVVYKDAYSVDLTKAYWWAAYRAGWLSKELFDEGCLLDKRIRLGSLGSWAKSIDIYKNKGDGQGEKLVEIVTPEYPHVFFNQANVVYKLMDKCRKAILPEDFMFYWTDGVYVSSEAAASICEEVLSLEGFLFKTTKLISIHREPDAFVSTEWSKKDQKEIEKRYNIRMT